LEQYFRQRKKFDEKVLKSQDLNSLGGRTLLRKYGSLPRLLATVYPENDWNVAKATNLSGKKTQFVLKLMLKELIPTEGKKFPRKIIIYRKLEALEDYRHPDIASQAGIPLELDFFYPRLNIAFEYQVS
jgi:hypothetical protein